MDDFTLSPYASKLDAISKQRYLKKLKLSEDCRFPDPYTIDENLWVTDPSLWPPVEFGDIYIYLKSTGEKDYDEESLKNYKSLSAYEYVVSGKVNNIRLLVKEQFFLLIAEVERSFNINLPNHLPWVVTSHNGSIETAHCTCMAGLGEACSHVAALLFQMEFESRLRSCIPTPTDILCKWQRPSTKQVESTKIKKMDLSKFSWRHCGVKRKFECLKVPDLPPLTEDEWHGLREVCPDAVLFNEFKSEDSSTDSASEEENEKNSPRIISLIKEAVLKDTDIKEYLLSHFTAAHCLNINQQSLGQSSNSLWFENRKGHLTASNFKTALKRKNWNRDFIIKLVNLKEEIKTAAMSWGLNQEKNALSSYIEVMSCQHVNFSVRSCGFIINPQYPFLGASPDGISNCDCCGEGIVEIKCPYKYKNSRIEDMLKDKLFYLSADKNLKENHAYFYQVQGQMALSRINFCDFIVWTPIDMAIKRIEFQEEVWDSNLILLEEIYFQHIVPILKFSILWHNPTLIILLDFFFKINHKKKMSINLFTMVLSWKVIILIMLEKWIISSSTLILF